MSAILVPTPSLRKVTKKVKWRINCIQFFEELQRTTIKEIIGDDYDINV